MVLVGFLLTLPLLFLVFGGRWGSTSFPASSPATSSPPVVSKPVARHVDAGGRGTTPQGQSKLPVLCTPLRFGL
jgi:xyloglucan fucosyltransferase